MPGHDEMFCQYTWSECFCGILTFPFCPFAYFCIVEREKRQELEAVVHNFTQRDFERFQRHVQHNAEMFVRPPTRQ